MHSAAIAYEEGGVSLEGFVAYASKKKSPLVILCHGWEGRSEFIEKKAKRVAKRGYVGFALDMYGKGVLGKSREECIALKKPFLEDRYLLQRRVVKAFEIASQLPYVDSRRIAVIGFGFGGICALDLARSGADLKGAVSIYGHFDPPPYHLVKSIRAKLLILHGYKDSLVSQEELRRFEKEMDGAKVDWQAHIYGNAMHAFAAPRANNPDAGILYNSAAATRSWVAAEVFLAEVL